jgi:hypothetical protein
VQTDHRRPVTLSEHEAADTGSLEGAAGHVMPVDHSGRRHAFARRRSALASGPPTCWRRLPARRLGRAAVPHAF